MRRVALVLIGCVMASFAVLAALILWLGWMFGVAVGLSIAAVVVTLYITVIGPLQRRWGTTDAQARGPMPGDDLLRSAAPSTTRPITIDAAPRDVFPWLVQIGYERGDWYSYDWIDNDGRRSMPKSFGTFVCTLISDPGAFVMERKMLRTIRSLAEPRRVD